MDERLPEIRKDLMKKLKTKRFWHTIGVSQTAAALAMRYDCDVEKAELAGMLHDCARQYSNSEVLSFCRKKGIPVSAEEEQSPILLHGKYGAYMAEHVYGVLEPDILSAITWHTTGHPEMTLLEKIIYLADYIEPNRSIQPRLKEIRNMAFINLDQALIMTMEDTLQYLQDSGSVIDQMSAVSLQYYKEQRSTEE